MRAKVIFALTIVCTFCFIEAVGQTRSDPSSQDTILLGATKLSIGMPLEAVIAELAEEHKVEKVGGASWLVMPKDGTLYPAVGSVDFKNDKVRKVRKYWGPEDQARGVEFATNLYGLIESFTEEGKRNCVISVGETHDPGYENRTAFISCGHKRIEISITRSDKLAGPAATVDEVLEDR